MPDIFTAIKHKSVIAGDIRNIRRINNDTIEIEFGIGPKKKDIGTNFTADKYLLETSEGYVMELTQEELEQIKNFVKHNPRKEE